MIHQTLSWHRTSERKPTSDRGPEVLAHQTEYDWTCIVTVAIVRDNPDRFDWWAELPRPKVPREPSGNTGHIKTP